MLIKNKFDYASLSRIDSSEGRSYGTPSGKLPSVTRILAETTPHEKKAALKAWRERVGEKTAAEITAQASCRGTRMHTHLEHYAQHGAMKERGSNPFSWASHAMAEVIIDKGMKNVNELWGIEVGLYFPEIYAGTTDSVGIHTGDQSIIDYKQTNKPKKKEWIEDYFMQLVAYSLAHNEVFGTSIRKGVVMMCVKPTMDDQCNIIQPPQYQEFVLEPSDFGKYEKMWWTRVEQYYMGIRSDK